MLLVGEFRHGEPLMLAEPLPAWVSQYLGGHLKSIPDSGDSPKDLNDIDAVRRANQVLKGKSGKKDKK